MKKLLCSMIVIGMGLSWSSSWSRGLPKYVSDVMSQSSSAPAHSTAYKDARRAQRILSILKSKCQYASEKHDAYRIYCPNGTEGMEGRRDITRPSKLLLRVYNSAGRVTLAMYCCKAKVVGSGEETACDKSGARSWIWNKFKKTRDCAGN